jgi:cell division protein FtsQ
MRSVRRKRGVRPNPRRMGWAKTVMLRPERGRGRRGRNGGTMSRLAGALRVTRRPMLFLTCMLIVGAVLAGLVAGGYAGRTYNALARSTGDAFGKLGFAVSRVTLQGNERTPADAVYAALAIQQGDSIFATDPALARARLLRLPWVADAEVRRQYPDTVSVVIVEKRPFALWKNGTEMAVVERSGAVITRTGLDEFARLPLVMGKGAPEAAAPLLDAIGGARAVAARIRAAEFVSERRWNLILDGNVVVKLPEEGWQRQIGELERLIVDKGVLEREIEVIDLRYPDSYIFRLHNGDSQPVPRERPA